MEKLNYQSIKTEKEYNDFLKKLYVAVKPEVEEIEIPPVKILAVDGNEPPGSGQYQEAVQALYGIGYTLKMGLKFDKLPRPKDYFDYGVGGLESLWWSKTGEVDISNAKTLLWKAYLMVPPFVDQVLVDLARDQAKQKKSEVNYDLVKLEEIEEGTSVQILNIGPYSEEKPSIDKLLDYAKAKGYEIAGHHHEIYISDPRRTVPEKLKTVIRHPVKKA